MASWDKDPIITPKGGAQASAKPWENDPVVGAPKAASDADPTRSIAGPAAESVNQYARGFGEGIPIVGPLVSGAADFVGSRIASLITGRTPEEESALAQERMQADREAHPIANMAGNISGAVMPLSQIGTAGGVASKALGVSGSLPARVGWGAVSGGAITGADALARGDSLESAADKAKWGFAIGGAAPVAERLAGMVFRAVSGQKLTASEEALARAIESDGIPLADLQKRINDLGPDAVLADLGPNLQRQAGALASMPGEAQQTVRSALGQRAAGTNARIQGDIDAALGPATTPRMFADEIAAQKKTLSPLYEQVFDNAKAVDTSPVALDLDSLIVNLRGEAQSRARSIRDMLNVVGANQLDPNPRTLMAVRQAIDDMYTEGLGNNAKRIITGARQKIDDILAQAAPGVKVLDEEFANLARQQEAFDTGQTVIDSGRTALRPADVDAMVAGSTPDILAGLTKGARAEIDRIIGTTTNNLTALKSALKGDGSWNRARLASLFGADKADELMRVLEREHTFAATADIVTRNSETAARQAAQAEVNAGAPQVMRDMTLTGMTMTGLQKLANLGAQTRQSGANSRIAEALMSNQLPPELVDSIAAALARRAKPSLLTPSAVSLALSGPLAQ